MMSSFACVMESSVFFIVATLITEVLFNYITHQPEVKCVLCATCRGHACKMHNTQGKNAGTRKCDGTAFMCMCEGH